VWVEKMSGELGAQAVKMDTDDSPPFSRLFVVCGKNATEEEISTHFSPYGTLQYCKLIRDRQTQESKGLCYVKFELASSAARAVEAMHGKVLSDASSPLKVMIAEAKRSSPLASSCYSQPSIEPEDTPPRSRLFVVGPKGMTEEQLIERFTVFGDLEYCKLQKERPPQEGQELLKKYNKTMAYVKFSLSSTAALAMERVNHEEEEKMNQGGSPENRMNLVVAQPRRKRSASTSHFGSLSYFGAPYSVRGGPAPTSVPSSSMSGAMGMSGWGSGPLSIGWPMTEDYLRQGAVMGSGLPSSASGLPISRQRLFVVCPKQVTQEQLARAFGKFPGMEYCDLKINKATMESKGFCYVNYSTPQAAAFAMDHMDGAEFPPHSGFTLKVVWADAKGVPSSAVPPLLPGGESSQPPSQSYVSQASDAHLPEGSRLFFALSIAVPEYALQDLFVRFPGLEYVRLQRDRPNCGYVKYSTAAAASTALAYLDGSSFYGQTLRVSVAKPPQERKRQRTA